jgi:hypothetical protein
VRLTAGLLAASEGRSKIVEPRTWNVELWIELVASAELSEALDNVDAAVGIAPLVVVPRDHAGVTVALGLSHQGIED